jgi:hypothetical protein
VVVEAEDGGLRFTTQRTVSEPEVVSASA